MRSWFEKVVLGFMGLLILGVANYIIELETGSNILAKLVTDPIGTMGRALSDLNGFDTQPTSVEEAEAVLSASKTIRTHKSSKGPTDYCDGGATESGYASVDNDVKKRRIRLPPHEDFGSSCSKCEGAG